MQRGTGAWEKPLLKNTKEVENTLHQYDWYSSDEENSRGESKTGGVPSSVFGEYPVSAQDELLQVGVSRVNKFLVAANSRAESCLICLEKVRTSDPIWFCNGSCYAVFHLVCIQSWSRQTKPGWNCPKCRAEYAEVPSEYRCYCGKSLDPVPDPWLTPHTCGERCEKVLGTCTHSCMLLCHPGPCPPCPQLVKLTCHCKKCTKVLRCGIEQFSCGRVCERLLGCQLHTCTEVCHKGECKPCGKVGLHRCKCGTVAEVRPCSEADFQCEKVCSKELNCGRHLCGKRCHPGSCGDCELQGRRTCPCGKQEFKDLSCDVRVPTCGSTCEKFLECGIHQCPERCHYGACGGTCRILTFKSCRCGGLRKEVPCYQDLVCERRCQGIRNCQRHACRRRCCDGACPPCSEVCGRKLRCGNHKCPAPCHRGLCAPCPLTVKISCACGYTTLEVPCGADKDTKPPKCSKLCQIPQVCGHAEQCKPHRCHYGPCPPCQLICDKKLACGHLCNIRCHGPRPPCAPQKGAKRDKNTIYIPTEGSPCPPCSELVISRCMGNHCEKLVPCTKNSEFSCNNLCGNVLPCGNHMCQEPCHVVTVRRTLCGSTVMVVSESQGYDSCTSCGMKCTKERSPPCRHPCEMDCHPGDCPPCKATLRKSCYCGRLNRTVECHTFKTMCEDERLGFLSCKGPCHRNLENCSHLCSETCHPGVCTQICQKKVNVRCVCQRIRKVWTCLEVQRAKGNNKGTFVLECDEECLRAKPSTEIQQSIQQRKVSEPEVRHDDVKKHTKHRRSRRNIHEESKYDYCKDVLGFVLKWFLVIAVLFAIGTSVYYGVQGLQSLSDWMNEIDAHSRKPNRRFP